MNRGNVFGINGKIETECLTVVGAQYAPIGAMSMEEVDRNTDVLLSFMDRASGGFPGFDLFVAPEACIQGFPQFGWEKALLTMDSPQIKKFQEKCAELEVYGVFDFLLRVDEQNNFTNTAIVINDKGEIIHRYDKMNPWFLSRVLYRDAAVRYATDRKVQNLVSSSVQMAIIRKCGAKQRCRGQM